MKEVNVIAGDVQLEDEPKKRRVGRPSKTNDEDGTFPAFDAEGFMLNTKTGERLRGYALIKARSDMEMRSFVPDPEEEAMIAWVAENVILKGRPPTYIEDLTNPAVDMPTRIFNLISDTSKGMRTIDGCSVLLGCVDDTFREWQKNHPRFSAAVKAGKLMQEMKAARRMSNGVTYPTSLIFTMKNLHSWADRIETVHSFGMKDMMEKYQTGATVVNWDTPAALPVPAGAFLEASVLDSPPNPEDAA